MHIKQDDLAGQQIRALVTFHVSEARGNSPPGHSFALDIDDLRTPELTFWSAWEGDTLLGCCALKQITPIHGEIKSMRTHPDHLRKGVAHNLLEHIISIGRHRGYLRISLETGARPAYSAAIALYESSGFERGKAFANYRNTEFNQCFHLDL